jgi:xanthine dehydrogenase iron-sulfur cluster and FAD-binding subunit A
MYPLELYVIVAEGIFHYRPKTHDLEQVGTNNILAALRKLSFDQECMDAPCVIAMAAVYERVTNKYPDVGKICVDFDGNDVWAGTSKGLGHGIGEGYYPKLRPVAAAVTRAEAK